jgi:hypothetical protein
MLGPYSSECAPAAVGTCLGGDGEAGAAALLATSERIGVPIKRPGTPMLVIAHALAAGGLKQELWDTRHGGWLLGDLFEQMAARRAAKEAERAAVEELRRLELPSIPPPAIVDPELLELVRRSVEMAAERAARRRPTIRTHTVASWLRRFGASNAHWLLFVAEPEAHVMVAFGDALVTGDAPWYRDRALTDVWRVVYPRLWRTKLRGLRR